MIEELVAAKTIAALRLAVAVSWGLIGAWGIPSMVRIVIGNTIRGDYFWSSMSLLALGLLIFQFRSLTGPNPIQPDYWVFAGLISFTLSAVGIFYTRAMAAPDAHKRAALISHLTVMVLLLAAGALS